MLRKTQLSSEKCGELVSISCIEYSLKQLKKTAEMLEAPQWFLMYFAAGQNF